MASYARRHFRRQRGSTRYRSSYKQRWGRTPWWYPLIFIGLATIPTLGVSLLALFPWAVWLINRD